MLFYFLQTNTEGTIQSVPDIKKKKIIKKKNVKEIVHPLNDLSFVFPEENYHIDDDDVPFVPTHPHRKVSKRLRLDIE